MSNITGSSQNQDLADLVSNLQASVNNIQSSFNNVQNNISSINNIDIDQYSKINNINSLDGAQNTLISNLNLDDTSTKNRITALENKFPLTNASILDNTINQGKIFNLLNDLSTINNNLTNIQNQVNTLSNNTSSDNTSLINSLNAQITKEQNDVNSINSQLNLLLNSKTGDNNVIQVQIDTIKNNQITDESNITSLSSNVNLLNGYNTTNQNNISSLQSDNNTNKTNISTLQSGLTTTNTNISNISTSVTSQLTTLTNNLNTQINKETSDLTNLNSALNTYISSNNSRLTTDEQNITNNSNNVSQNTNDITNLKSDNNTNKNNISNLQTNVNSLITDNSGNKINITNNANDIITINNKLALDETNISSNTTDISNIKSYNVTNTSNINTINNNIQNNTDSINNLNNNVIPNLSNVFLPINNPSVTGVLNVNEIDCNDVLKIGENATTIFLGSTQNNDSKVINLGGPNDTVNIIGSLNSVKTTNTQISNKTITLNEGEVGNNQSSACGFLIRDNDNDNQGYITTNSDSTKFLIKPPQNNNIYGIGTVSGFYDLTTKLYVDTHDSALQSNITNLLNQVTNVNNEISGINSNVVFKPQNGTSNEFLAGNGFYYPIVNNIVLSNDSNTYLNGLGNFVSVTNNDSQITALQTDNTTNKSNITSLQTDNTTNKSNIISLQTDNTSNKSNIISLQTDNTSNKNNILSLQTDNTTNKNNILSLQTDNTTNKSNISNHTTSINGINANLTNVLLSQALDETHITSLQTDNTTNKSNISSHTTSINTINTNISNILNNPSITGTITTSILDTTTGGNLNIGQKAISINIGADNSGDIKTINIGGANDIINIQGAVNNITTTNLEINDKLITLNKNAVGSNVAGSSGFQIRDNNVDNTGYIMTSTDGTQLLIKPPQNINIMTITDTPTNNYDLTTKSYVDNKVIPFSKITFPTNSSQVVFGDGTYGHLTNNNISDGVIMPAKLYNLADQTKYLRGDATWATLPTYANTLQLSGGKISGTIDMSGNAITNLIQPTNLQDAATKNYVDSNLNFYISKQGFTAMAANLDLGNNKIINVSTPTNNTDAVNKFYADWVNSNIYQNEIYTSPYIPTGSGMTIPMNRLLVLDEINMTNHNIINLADPSPLSNYFLQSGVSVNYLNNVYSGLINNYLINNSIATNKLVGITGNGTKYLLDDGTFGTCLKAINPTTPYVGSLSGISCNILIVGNDTLTTLKTNMNNLIISLGGSLSLINITVLTSYPTGAYTWAYNFCYSNNFDCVLIETSSLPVDLTLIDVLNRYSMNNKGVVLAQYTLTTSNNVPLSFLNKKITNTNGTMTYNLSQNITQTTAMQQSSSILYGVSSVYCENGTNIFNPVNSATSIGSSGINGSNVPLVNYLDSNLINQGRRVDINTTIYSTSDTTTSGLTRLVLQACLWSARKII